MPTPHDTMPNALAGMAAVAAEHSRIAERVSAAAAVNADAVRSLERLTAEIQRTAKAVAAQLERAPQAGETAHELRFLARRNAALTNELIRFMEHAPSVVGVLTMGALRGFPSSWDALRRKAAAGDAHAAEALELCERITAHVAAVVVLLATAAAVLSAHAVPEARALSERDPLTGCLSPNAPPLAPMCASESARGAKAIRRTSPHERKHHT